MSTTNPHRFARNIASSVFRLATSKKTEAAATIAIWGATEIAAFHNAAAALVGLGNVLTCAGLGHVGARVWKSIPDGAPDSAVDSFD